LARSAVIRYRWQFASIRAPETVIAILGILMAGAAFVPLNPAVPRERLVEMLATARPKVAITRRSDLPAGYTIDVLMAWPEVEQLLL
jgi:non-ribosomal peptide synthetase component F